MADEDIEELPPAAAYEAVERRVWAWLLAPGRQDCQDALHALEARVKARERPTPEEIREARRALDRARALVEDVYADLATDTNPWEDGVSATAPHGELAAQLEANDYTVHRPGDEPVVDLAEVHGNDHGGGT